MPNGAGWTRWGPRQTIGGVDPDTPLVDLLDQSEYDRDGIILVNDAQRRHLATLVRKAERDENVLVFREEGARWWQSRLGRVALLSTIAAAWFGILAELHTLLPPGK